MDKVKLENFCKEHPGVVPPAVQPLSSEEAERYKGLIAERLSLWAGDSGLAIVTRLVEVESVVRGLDADTDSFDLAAAANVARINPQKDVLINWYRFDKIDRMLWTDLVKYLPDLWYPSADDIDVFDDSCQWVLSIMHYGVVRVVHFPLAAA